MLTVYTVEQSNQWDGIVRTFSQYDVYWLSGYVNAFRIHGDGEPLLFYYEDKSVRGINVVIKRDIADDPHFAGKLEHGKYYDFSTPYGYGGWLITGDGKERLFGEYRKWCIENNIICEFVRFHPMVGNHESVSEFYEVIRLGQTVFMDLKSPEVIWANITSKNRNMIRKAQKNGVKIARDSSPEIYSTFKKIYDGTMDKDHAEKYYYFETEFYESVRKDLDGHAEVFYAIYEDKIIAASIILFVNGCMDYHLSGSLREYYSLAPTNLLLYEAALWGSENGYRTLYLGGGVGSEQDNLFTFKKSFNRRENYPFFYIGKTVFNENKYDEFISMRDVVPESNYFPKYRA